MEVKLWPPAARKHTMHEWAVLCPLKWPEAGPSALMSSTSPQTRECHRRDGEVFSGPRGSANSSKGFQEPVQMSVSIDFQFAKPTFSCGRWSVSRGRRKEERKEQTRGATASSLQRQLMTVGVSSGGAHYRAACCSMWCKPSWACRCRTAGSQRRR